MFEKFKAKMRKAVVEDTVRKIQPYVIQLEKYGYPEEGDVICKALDSILTEQNNAWLSLSRENKERKE